MDYIHILVFSVFWILKADVNLKRTAKTVETKKGRNSGDMERNIKTWSIKLRGARGKNVINIF